MARLVGPLMSLDASGSIAGALTFAKNKGRQYVRQLVIPSNPKTPSQTAFRAFMRYISQMWAMLPSYDPAYQGTWQSLADASNVSPFNAYTGYNQGQLKYGQMPSQAYPPGNQTPDPTGLTFSATGGVRQITIAIDSSGAAFTSALIIHRSLSIGFTPSFNDIIAVIDGTNPGTFSYVDSPLDPGTYAYRIGVSSGDGGPEVLFATEHTATAT